MTKISTKKFVAIIMVILCSFCIIAIPVYASSTDNETIVSSGASLTYLGDNDPQTRSINSVRPKSLYVYPAEYANGQYTADSNWYAYAGGTATSILSCTVPKEMADEMTELGLNHFVNRLYFSVDGTNLSRVELRVNGNTVLSGSLTSSGNYYVEWTTTKTNSQYEVVVYSSNTNAIIFGTITIER